MKEEEVDVLCRELAMSRQDVLQYLPSDVNSNLCRYESDPRKMVDPVDVVQLYAFGPLQTNKKEREKTGTLLHKAIAEEKWTSVDILIKHGADVTLKNSIGETPLMIAAFKLEDEAILAKLLDGVDVNCTDKYGYTAIYNAIQLYNWPAARFLLSHGCNVDLKPARQSNNCLTMALKPFNPSEEYFNRRSAREPKHIWDRTPLDILEKLITKESAVHEFEKKKFPLTLACQYGYWEILRKLVECGLAPDDSRFACSPLITAMKSRKVIPAEYMKHLIAGKINKQFDDTHNTALHEAIGTGKWDCVRELLKAGANVNVMNGYNSITLYKFIGAGCIYSVPLDLIPKLIPKDFEHVFGVLMTLSLAGLEDPVPSDQILTFLQYMPTPIKVFRYAPLEVHGWFSGGFRLNAIEFSYQFNREMDPVIFSYQTDILTYLITETCIVKSIDGVPPRRVRKAPFLKRAMTRIEMPLDIDCQQLIESQQPNSLVKLAVFKVRQRMKRKSLNAFNRLGLEDMLKKMVTFEDVGRKMMEKMKECRDFEYSESE